MKKVVENKVFNRRRPMFSCIRLRKRQQCCKPKIGGETQVTNNLYSQSSKDLIQYMTMCERSIMWYCSHELLSSSFEMGMATFKHAQSWWRSFVWGMRDMKWSWNLWHQDKPRRINIRWRRKYKKKELKKKKYKL